MSILVVGDSYSAGNGAGSYYGPKGCWRSRRNYAEDFADALRGSPYLQPSVVTNAACSGARTSWFFSGVSGRPPELAAVNSRYDAIFITVGGDDVAFANLVKFCLIAKTRDGAHCRQDLDRALSLMQDGTVSAGIERVLAAIEARANPRAKIILLGYPYLEGDSRYTLTDRRERAALRADPCVAHRGRAKLVTVGGCLYRIEKLGDQIQRSVVGHLNASDQQHPFVFEPTKQLFAGRPNHELFAKRNNPHRWFVQPFVDASFASHETWYHPNPAGWAAEARLLLNDPAVPKHPIQAPANPAPIATDVSAGSNEADCARLSSARVDCWGWGDSGQLGDGTEGGNHSRPVAVKLPGQASAVSTGDGHACALMVSTTVQCWGLDQSGQLGASTPSNNSDTPEAVQNVTHATAIAAGGRHTCALIAGGTVECWGGGVHGQLGNGDSVSTETPVRVSGITTAVAVSSGLYHSCALLQGGGIDCWGFDLFGQLGDGQDPSVEGGSTVPVAVVGIQNAVSVSAGGEQTCAVLASGAVDCWGLNNDGQLGDGTTNDSDTPVSVTGITSATSVATSVSLDSNSQEGGSACASLRDGSVWCWGDNSTEQLANAQLDNSRAPIKVGGVQGASAVTAGARTACALISDGSVKCWGWNLGGQLGDGNPLLASPTPGTVGPFR